MMQPGQQMQQVAVSLPPGAQYVVVRVPPFPRVRDRRARVGDGRVFHEFHRA